MTHLVTYAAGGLRGVGVRYDDGIAPVGRSSMLQLVAAGPDGLRDALAAAEASASEGAYVEDAALLAPIRPGKLIFCGVNYPSHLDENPGATLPRVPFLFSKLPNAVIGPLEPIVLPQPASQVDYEVELAVVIGRRARRIEPQEALDYVFGYTVVNDVSARDIQFADSQITLGKGMDTFCPLGPVIALPDSIPNPSDLEVSALVNGEERQRDVTSNLIFPIPELLSFVTAAITLEPGDLVTTGTPAGVACFRDPPEYLRPGDEVTVAVDRIGALTNPVVAGW